MQMFILPTCFYSLVCRKQFCFLPVSGSELHVVFMDVPALPCGASSSSLYLSVLARSVIGTAVVSSGTAAARNLQKTFICFCPDHQWHRVGATAFQLRAYFPELRRDSLQRRQSARPDMIAGLPPVWSKSEEGMCALSMCA